MDTIELAHQVKEVRDLQKAYFATKNKGVLGASKAKEKELDLVVDGIIANDLTPLPPLLQGEGMMAEPELVDGFEEWAERFFCQSPGRINAYVRRGEAYDDFRGTFMLTPRFFFQNLRVWCNLRQFDLNPPALCNNGHRIIRMIEGAAVECIYIQRNGQHLADAGPSPGNGGVKAVTFAEPAQLSGNAIWDDGEVDMDPYGGI